MLFRSLGRTGLAVSILGFGASPLGEEFGPIDAAEFALQMTEGVGLVKFKTEN